MLFTLRPPAAERRPAPRSALLSSSTSRSRSPGRPSWLPPRRSTRFWSRPLAATALPLALLPATPAAAQSDRPPGGRVSPAAELAPQVVTATRQPGRADETISSVTLIDRPDIERAGERSLVDLLDGLAGLQQSNSGGLGRPSSIFFRGLEARHTLLLVDGVPAGSATVGSPSLDNLPLEAMERIEIVRGPLSGLYGSAAVGGVVQLFTRSGAEAASGWSPYAKAAVGSRSYRQIAAGTAFKGGDVDGLLHAQLTDVDGFSATNSNVPFGQYNPDRDGFGQTGGVARLGWSPRPGWRIDGLLLESAGRVQFDDGPGGDARARVRNGIQSLQASGEPRAGWHTRLALSRSVDTYDTRSSASPFTTLGPISTDQRQLSWENGITTPLGTVLALVERIEQTVAMPAPGYTTSDRSINAVAVGLDGRSGPHAWQGSVRLDRNSQFGRQTTGAIGYSYALLPRLRVGGSYGSTFVAPSFNQLYYPGFGNASLRPEEGRHAELFGQFHHDRGSVRLAGYQHRIRGYISSGPNPVNVPRSRIDGIELAWDQRLGAWRLGGSIEHLDPRNTTAGSPNDGRQLPRRAKNAFKMQADRRIGMIEAGGQLRAFSGRYDDAANTERLGGFALLDLRAEWRLAPQWRLGLFANNVADKRYETAYGYNQAGREWFLVLRWAARDGG